MSAGSLPETVTIQSQLDRRTLLVGSEEDITTNFPQIAPDILACEQLKVCGALSEEDPAAELWQRIQELQPERLWILGGDGTINLVGECAIRNHLALALPSWLTPAGTANDLARALTDRAAELNASTETEPNDSLEGKNPEDASALALDLLEVQLDHGAHVKCCANMFTLGTSARNTQHVTSEIKARWGAFAYLTQLWQAIGDLRPFKIRLRVGDAHERMVDDILNLFVANGPYCGGGYRVAPPAQIDDGLLNVVIIRQGTTAELAHLTAAFLAGTYLDHNLVEHFTTSNLSIACEHTSPLTLDGEAFAAREIAIRILPRHLLIDLVQPR